jgi:hypothetical protein
MMRWLRRVMWLSFLIGLGFGGYQAWSRRRAPLPSSPPQWPPLRSDSPRPWTAATLTPPESPAPAWLPTVDGACPDGYPFKANDNSRIFHSPGGRFYDRTVAERCYARAEDAIADGYRPAKA